MGAGVTTKLVVVLALTFPIFSGSARAQVSEGTHSPHGNLAVPCQNCHTASSWKPIRAVPEFDHNQTRYPLRGMHASVACTGCHVKMVFSSVGHSCQDCHADIHRRQLGANCEQCHSVRGWQVAIKDIEAHNNRFPLTGAHAAVDCDACHKGGANSQFQTMSTACFSCHQSDFTTTNNPSHIKAQFSTTCESCHTTDNWLNVNVTGFDHSTTGFVLSGGHAVPPRQCADCHVNNNYTLGALPCVGCHQQDFNAATTPVLHTGFPATCESCHDTVQWTDGKFDHSTTGFTLTGQHTVPPRACADCHVNNNYSLNSTACVGCHMKDFQNTTSPNHVTANFSETCSNCHDTSNWTDATFDHSTTGFVLTGQHTLPPRTCSDCHNSKFGNYNIANGACVTCHLTDFQNSTNPNHAVLNLSTTCDNCHTTAGWSPVTAGFDHNGVGFPLNGMHTVPPRTCADCHGTANGGNYALGTNTCVSCHLTDYQNTSNPNHQAAGIATTCETCHNTGTWTGAQFDHTKSGFPLTNAHAVPPLQCDSCHNATFGNYNISSGACVNCHQTDYNNAVSPVNHTALGFPTSCQTCHDTVQWTDGKFDHTSTGFLLTNAHSDPPLQCISCHNPQFGNYNIASGACANCHQTDYNNATTPVNHVQAGFPLTCETCHDTVLWTDGKFDHTSTGFPLSNAHSDPPLQCNSCHNATFGNYSISSGNCVNCHQTDYNNATTPVNHVAMGFPTTCASCHDTVVWTDGKFDHTTTGFPLTNAHSDPPLLCNNCHNATFGVNLTSGTCVNCHQTDYNNATTPINHAALGFPTTCDLCHDTKLWTDGTFNHNNTAFPLIGQHTSPPRQCADCHVNNNYTTLPTTCIGCHAADYNTNSTPLHGSSANSTYFPTTCLNCHDTTENTWLNATFPHINYTQFSVNHGNAGGVCSTCHTTSNSLSIFQCTNCHGGNNPNNFQHRPVNGYVYNSINCYQCHSSGGGG